MKDVLSPCTHCTRVKDSQNCENKNCKPWRKWFFAQWEETRKLYRKGMDHPRQTQGIALGGQRYCSPHRITEYLQTDPCTICKLPAELCDKECKQKLQWKQANEEVANELENGSDR